MLPLLLADQHQPVLGAGHGTFDQNDVVLGTHADDQKAHFRHGFIAPMARHLTSFEDVAGEGVVTYRTIVAVHLFAAVRILGAGEVPAAHTALVALAHALAGHLDHIAGGEDVHGELLAGLLLCFACAGQKGRAIGRAVFAFGLLFEGIADMGTAMEPLAQGPVFVHWLSRVRQHPWLGLLAGLGMTLTVQSSSATIALLQNFAARPGLDGSSLLGLAGALPVLLGDNIGTTITAVLASLSASRDAKRVAVAHAVFNLTGAAVFCAGLPLYVRLTAALSPKGPELAVIARQIANAHTLFNVVCTLVWLPLTPLMVRFVCRLVPDRAVR